LINQPTLTGSMEAAQLLTNPARVQDKQFWSVMQCMEAYLEAQEELAASLKAGLFDIAKAKYSLGPGSLGQQCYPGDMHAAVTVQLQQPDAQPDSIYDTFQLSEQLQQCHLKPAAQAQQQQHATADQPAGKRQQQRQGLQDDSLQQQDAHGNTAHHAANDHRSSSSGHKIDPVHWFSALPPAPLKSAQGNFKTALQRAVAAANKVQELRHLLQDLQDSCGSDAAQASETG
jgi:hypothetical protein